MVDYDADHMAPVSTDTILMEAAQMVDEWPLSRRSGDVTAIYRRAQGVEELRLVTGQKNAPEGTLSVSKAEAETWRWIGRSEDVGDVMERAFLSDFEVLKGTADLLGRPPHRAGAVEAVGAAAPAARRGSDRGRGVSPTASPVGLLGAALSWRCHLDPAQSGELFLQPPGDAGAGGGALKAVSLNRAVSIERAVRVYYDSSGRYPARWRTSWSRGSSRRTRLRTLRPLLPLHPAGRRRKFGLYGRNAAGQIDLDLSLERSLAPVAGVGRPAPPPSPSLPAFSSSNKELSLLHLA